MLIASLICRLLGRAIVGLLLLCSATAWAFDDATSASAEAAPELAIFAEIPDVLGASRHVQKISDAPASITVISAEEIERIGYRTLGEVVNAAVGVFATNDRNYSALVVRGFGRPGSYNTRILLLIDGHRTNDEVFGTASVGGDAPVDISAIDRVEIIRGASSSLYGTDALLAVINVVTKSGSSDPGTKVTVERGSQVERRASAKWGKQFDSGLAVFMQAAARDTRGERLYYPEFQNDTPTRGRTGLRDGEELSALFTKVEFANWHFQAAYLSRDKSIPTASFETIFNDPRTKTVDRKFFALVRYQRPLREGAQISTTLAHDRGVEHGWYPYEEGLFNDGAKSVGWTYDMQYLGPAAARNRWVAGFELRRIPQQRQYAYNNDPEQSELDIDESSSAWAVFAQDEWQLTKRVNLNVGARIDDHDQFGTSTSPRLALIVAPDPKSRWKLLAGRAFRAPNQYESEYTDGITQKGNPGLTPERLLMLEAIYERTLAEGAHGSVTLYRYRASRLIEQVSDPADQLDVYVNRGAVRATGAEVNLEGSLIGGLEGRVSYAWQRALDAQTDAVLSNAPSTLVKVLLWAPLGTRAWALGLNGQYVGSRRALDQSKIGSYATLGASLRYKPPTTGLVVALTATNLLDAEYSDPGGEEHRQSAIPQDGRLWRLRLSYEF